MEALSGTGLDLIVYANSDTYGARSDGWEQRHVTRLDKALSVMWLRPKAWNYRLGRKEITDQLIKRALIQPHTASTSTWGNEHRFACVASFRILCGHGFGPSSRSTRGHCARAQGASS